MHNSLILAHVAPDSQPALPYPSSRGPFGRRSLSCPFAANSRHLRLFFVFTDRTSRNVSDVLGEAMTKRTNKERRRRSNKIDSPQAFQWVAPGRD
uniref:Integron gene cassette protein n=1 Tax=Steinernema glaseri TaxID=37863 RepID=A0A1I7YWI8_9BILA